MAYGGKPSRGCQMCRIRRIKCDETKPACKQCAKARRQCPGYRGADQSGARIGPSRPTTLAPRSASSGSSLPTSPPIPSLLPPLEDVASCHFISNYVLIPRQGLITTRGWLEFVVPLLKQDPPIPHFKHAFNACATASLNNRVGTGNDFERQALGHYTKALAATFTALRDPDMVKHDATLASILLLSLFESITAKSLGMFAWSSHIEGAIELVKTRGPEQLKTKTGSDLFSAVRIQMIIHSLSTGKAPNMNIEWWTHDSVSSGHSAEFQQLSGRTGLLRNEVNSLLGTLTRTPGNTKLMEACIQRCRALDKEVVEWLHGLPDVYGWKTVAWEDYNPKRDYAKAEAFPGRIDLYRDLWVVNMWNVMRCMRIVLASLIIRLTAWTISPADYRTTPEYAAVSRTCGEAIADIIASIPYQLGWFSRRKHLRVVEQLSGFACGEDNTNKSLAGFFAIWPLVCVQGQDYMTDLQRMWVKGRLKCIANELGVRYADMLSRLNVRMPSMLILRDRLKGNPQSMPVDFGGVSPGKQSGGGEEGAATATATAPHPGSSPEALNKQEEAYRKIVQLQTEQLKNQAVESKGAVDEWTVKTWLQL
ncbi:hypothetical protein G6O67_002079 [Ophiocordyceps sinensis]|uniref:Zn(2)-C6 fungal-type domain-containing protein n=1 Tax=Ophiocordyceps sinensis TaxID=72228 RepID=A0A8H4V6W5_9HYPO|nr:hypothetical protein G6O67_002079 [Ophiocordyceps sinensis]